MREEADKRVWVTGNRQWNRAVENRQWNLDNGTWLSRSRSNELCSKRVREKAGKNMPKAMSRPPPSPAAQYPVFRVKGLGFSHRTISRVVCMSVRV